MDERWSSARSVRAAQYGRAAIARALLPAVLAAGVLPAVGATAHAAVPAPEGRVYELVSPPDKDLGTVASVMAADDHGGVMFSINGAVGDPLSFTAFTTMRAVRTPDRWQQVAIAAAPSVVPEPTASFYDTSVIAVSDDSAQAIVSSNLPLQPRDRDEAHDLYRIDVATGAATLISAVASGDDASAATPALTGATGDFRRIVFSMAAPLVSDAPAGGGVYEWADDAVSLVSRRADGTPQPAPAVSSTNAFYRSTTDRPSSAAVAHGGAHPVSDDGSTIFWQASTQPTFAGRLFARVDGDQTISYTTSQRTVAGGTPAGTAATSARFVAATRDGAVVLFASTEQLTDAATTGGGLYRYTFADGRLEQVTPASQAGAAVSITSVTASDGGSHVYFLTRAALTPEAINNVLNVYVWSADEGTRLVAEVGNTGTRVERVSRDGRFAVFSSRASIAGGQSGGMAVLYRYDATTATLRCASCRLDGTPAGAATVLERGGGTVASRNIADDGTVFFTTPDALVDGDINGVDDAYGFDGERPFLVSTGRGTRASFMGDNSDDGRDVYFVTEASLVDEDVDGGLADVYDARRGGGFPPQPAPPVRCSGIDCGPPAPPAPDLLIPQSEVLDGSGNVVDEPRRPSVRPSLRVGRVGVAAKKRFARTGRIRIVVRTSTQAKVTATLSVRVGRRWVRTDRVVRGFGSSGRATLQLSLSADARRTLADRGLLRVRVQVNSSRTTDTSTQSLVLRSKNTSRGGGR